MFKFEVTNELYLKATCIDGRGAIFTKAGAFVAGVGQGNGHPGYEFEKVLLGPQGNPVAAAISQVFRRLSGENLPLMKVTPRQGIPTETYYANQSQHITVIELQQGQTISVESENILAFTDSCKYGGRFMAQGVISQKGLFTSTLTGMGPGAYVAILTDGNPMVLSANGSNIIRVDPDASVAWIGGDPEFKLDLSWKNLIGQASGESYQFQWTRAGSVVLLQPSERKSGVDIGIDGRNTGAQPQMQQNQTIGGAMGNAGQAMNSVGGMLNNLMGGGR